MMTNSWWPNMFCQKGCKSALFTLITIAVLATASLAAVPDWLRSAAMQAVPSYPADSNTNAVLLLDEKIITVKDNGEIATVHHVAYKVLNSKGRGVAKVIIPFDSETKLSNVHAWSLPADGSKAYELKEKDMAEVAMSESFYDDDREKAFEIPAADPGNVVGYEYEQRQRPYVLQDQFWFQHSYPVLDARLSLTIPAGWETDVHFVNYPEQKPVQQGTTHVWEMRNIPGIQSEPEMPPYRAIESRMLINYFPSKDELKPRAHGSWARVGAWFQGLTDGRTDASPDIRQKVADLTAGAPDALAKIRRVSEWVQHDIRYVAIEVGIGGYQPHPASTVFSSHYGDCKDKATLLISMLRQAGVSAYYVVLNANRGVVLPDYPAATAFNHVIVAIPLPPGAATTGLRSVYDDKQLGTLLIFDPTSELTPFGELPSEEQGGYALLVNGSGGDLIQLPLLDASTNRLERTAKLTLSDDGTLSGSVEELRTGYLASQQRSGLLGASPANRQKVVESFLNDFLSGFALKSSAVDNLDKYSDPLIVHYTFEAPLYVKHAGNLLLLRPRVLGAKSEDSLESDRQRQFPFAFQGKTTQTDKYEIVLPADLKVDELPDPVKIDCGYVAYESKSELEGDRLVYTRTYTVNSVIVPLQDVPKVKKFFRQVLADEQSSAVLKKASVQ